MKILIVEDDLVQRRFLQTLLVNAGHEVVAVSEGVDAWDLLEDGTVRMVITDWMNPTLDGPELIRRIREGNPHKSYTYLILLTSKDKTSSIVEGLESGADDYLTKPYDREVLLARVKIGERIINLETRLQQLATQDSLTGLPNRPSLYERAQAELNRASREGTTVSFILLDVDHFKLVNDRYGHPVGDMALKQLAEIMRDRKRAYDHVGRWGGEEFLMLLPNTDLNEAGKVAERLRKSVAAARLPLPRGGDLIFTISIGVSSTSGPGAWTLEGLVQQADEALYHAKETGRNRVCLYLQGIHSPSD